VFATLGEREDLVIWRGTTMTQDDDWHRACVQPASGRLTGLAAAPLVTGREWCGSDQAERKTMRDEGRMPAHLQPVAVHRGDATRLIARDEGGAWWLWRGDRLHEPLEPVPTALASVMLNRPEMQALPLPHFWFSPDSLPLGAASGSEPIGLAGHGD
jgi:hypothetical protein